MNYDLTKISVEWAGVVHPVKQIIFLSDRVVIPVGIGSKTLLSFEKLIIYTTPDGGNFVLKKDNFIGVS